MGSAVVRAPSSGGGHRLDTQRAQGTCPGWEAGSLLAIGFPPRGLPAVLAGLIITALALVKVQLTWSYWGRRPEMRCVLCRCIGELHHRTPSVSQPLAWACVSLASRPELRTYKETYKCVYCQSLAFILFAQGFFSFLMNVLVFLPRLARGGLTQPHASGQRADVLSWLPACVARPWPVLLPSETLSRPARP